MIPESAIKKKERVIIFSVQIAAQLTEPSDTILPCLSRGFRGALINRIVIPVFAIRKKKKSDYFFSSNGTHMQRALFETLLNQTEIRLYPIEINYFH